MERRLVIGIAGLMLVAAVLIASMTESKAQVPVADGKLVLLTSSDGNQDTVVVYHSQSDKAAIGLGEVVRAPYPDPTDPAGKRVWVDVGAGRRLDRPVTLAEMKAAPVFASSLLVRQSRLSVVPLDGDQLAEIERLAGGPVSG